METRYIVTLRGQTIPVTIAESEGRVLVTVSGHEYKVDVRHITGTPLWSLLVDNRAHQALLVREESGWRVQLDGSSESVDIGTERDLILRQFTPQQKSRSGSETVKSPMPGLVVGVRVREGDRVQPGDSMATVEAMKMENEFRTAHAGIVTKVHVKTGDSVSKNAPLVTIRVEG